MKRPPDMVRPARRSALEHRLNETLKASVNLSNYLRRDPKHRDCPEGTTCPVCGPARIMLRHALALNGHTL